MFWFTTQSLWKSRHYHYLLTNTGEIVVPTTESEVKTAQNELAKFYSCEVVCTASCVTRCQIADWHIKKLPMNLGLLTTSSNAKRLAFWRPLTFYSIAEWGYYPRTRRWTGTSQYIIRIWLKRTTTLAVSYREVRYQQKNMQCSTISWLC